MKLRLQPYQCFILLFLVSMAIYVAGILRVKSLIWGDSLYYYSYTRSIVIDQDINFINEAYHPNLGFPNPVEYSEITGRVTNKFSPGPALFWIPAFIFGQLISYLGNILIGYEYFLIDGTGILPQYFVAVSSVLFSVLGLWFVFNTLTNWFSQKTAGIAVFILFLNTQIFYYLTMDPINSHSISFLLSSLLLYQLSKVLKTSINWQKVIPMGITAGFLMLVRNQDVVVVIPILLALLFSKKESLLSKFNWITLYDGSAFIIFSVQIYTTLTLFGILGSPYLMRGEKFSWFQPNFFRVLFTQENGLFFFSPILFFGLFFLCKTLVFQFKLRSGNLFSKPLFLITLTALVSFLLQLYVVASWGKEIIGGPYGTRMFISVLPHLTFGIALFIKHINKKLTSKKITIIVISLISVLFINNIFQTLLMLYLF
jgi:hypothetical protein